MLPMLPIYISYFVAEGSDASLPVQNHGIEGETAEEAGGKFRNRAGDINDDAAKRADISAEIKAENRVFADTAVTRTQERRKASSALLPAIAFVLGFTVLFTALGVFAGALGGFLSAHRRAVEIVSGLIVILFALSFLNIIRLPFFKGLEKGRQVRGLFSAFFFGMIYAVSLTPCVGAFLGSALLLASYSATAGKGFLLLVCYSLGLGIPFILSAVLLKQLTGAFAFIKRHYCVINLCAGGFLILVGISMATGMLNRLLILFA